MRLVEDRANPRAALQPLVAGFANPSGKVQAASLYAIGRIIPKLDDKHAAQVVDRQVVPALLRVASQPRTSTQVRTAAANALHEAKKAMGRPALEARIAALLPVEDATRVKRMFD